MIASLLIALAPSQDPAPSVPPVAKPVVTIEPAPIAVPLVSAMSPDNQRLAVDTRTGGIWVLDLVESKWVRTIAPRGHQVSEIVWSTDGTKLAIIGVEGQVEIIDSDSRKVISSFRSSPHPISTFPHSSCVDFAAGDSVLVSRLGRLVGEIRSVADGHRIAELTNDAPMNASVMAVSRDRELVAFAATDAGMGVWKARTGERVAGPARITWRTGSIEGVRALDFHPNGTMLALAGGDCAVRLWTFTEGGAIRELSHCDQDIFGGLAVGEVCFNRDGTRLLSTSYQYDDARVWDPLTGKLIESFECNDGDPAPAWFTSDGRYVAMSLGCRIFRVCEPEWPIPGASTTAPHEAQERYRHLGQRTRYEHSGDFVWAIEQDALVVRRLPTGDIAAAISVLPEPGPIPPAKGAGGK